VADPTGNVLRPDAVDEPALDVWSERLRARPAELRAG
jgi:hypothetical protein